MNIKSIILAVILTTAVFGLSAQYTNTNTVITYSDPQIEDLVELHIIYNEVFPVIEGYRIQLIMLAGNTALDEINEKKTEFEKSHPAISTYITFREPYYRLRVGDFRTRLDAVEFMESIKRSYPQAWVIKDKITFPELTKYKKTFNYE
ncbi:MAG: SPOR domain-containing protein [Bacteroidales bacterium]|jgi:hypothetical protein|nr:SPOR domain-containing protein [Bacteroidales bacterium]